MVEINSEKCIGCGRCAADCVAHNIELSEQKARIRRDCLECGHCVAVCPVNAVTLPGCDMEDVEEYCAETFCPDPGQVLHSIKFRRSIRSYRPEKPERDTLELLVQAGRYTATAKNTQSNGFLFIQEHLDTLKSMTWQFIDELDQQKAHRDCKDLLPYFSFNRQRKKDPDNDFLFRNAPTVLFITSDNPLDAGLAAQNIENMAVSLGMGILYNGYLARISDLNPALKQWLGAEGKTIQACMLLGYPAVRYRRTAPRKEACVIWR